MEFYVHLELMLLHRCARIPGALEIRREGCTGGTHQVLGLRDMEVATPALPWKQLFQQGTGGTC